MGITNLKFQMKRAEKEMKNITQNRRISFRKKIDKRTQTNVVIFWRKKQYKKKRHNKHMTRGWQK